MMKNLKRLIEGQYHRHERRRQTEMARRRSPAQTIAVIRRDQPPQRHRRNGPRAVSDACPQIRTLSWHIDSISHGFMTLTDSQCAPDRRSKSGCSASASAVSGRWRAVEWPATSDVQCPALPCEYPTSVVRP